ncbi:MAG: 4Fe-4S ferredoxin, partial [Gemmatimonadales bacterium]
MKTLINSCYPPFLTRKVDSHIPPGVSEASCHCDLTTLTDVKPESLADYDLVGLGCPVFYYNAPFNVRDFMQGLP